MSKSEIEYVGLLLDAIGARTSLPNRDYGDSEVREVLESQLKEIQRVLELIQAIWPILAEAT